MQIIIDNVFLIKWEGLKLDEKYNGYDVDLISYVYGESISISF